MTLSIVSLAAVFLSSAVAAMGLGGGTVLMLYLSLFSSLPQPQLQDLLLFLPAAALSLFLHRKNGLVQTKLLTPCILGGLLGAIGGSLLSNWIDPGALRKGFGLFLLVIGLREGVLAVRSLREKS